MPTVPRIATQQVQDQAPNIRQQNLRAPNLDLAESRQAVTQLNQSSLNLAQQAIGIQQVELDKANQLQVLEADQKLASLETKLLYDRESGAMNQKGKNAFALPDTVFAYYDEQVSEIEKSLGNEAQKNEFRKRVVSRRGDIDRQLQRHIAREGAIYDEQVTTSFVANEQDAAIKNFHDEDRVQLAIQRQREAMLQHADRNGIPASAMKQQVEQVESKTYAAVIGRILDGGGDMAAKAYYDKYRDRLRGDDQVKVAKLLEDGMLRGKAQRASDKIWVDTNADLGQSLAKAERINDPQLRDETVRRIRLKQANLDQAIQANQNRNFMMASEYIKNAPGVDPKDAMPVSQWNALTLQQQKALRKYSNNPTNNDKKWLDFLEKDPQEIAGMTRAEFEQNYWVHFDSAHRSRAEKMWTDSSSGDTARTNLTQTLSFRRRVDNVLRASEIVDPTKSKAKFSDAEAKTYTQFETAAAKAVEEFELTELGGKRKASGEEIQQILDKMVLQKVYLDKNWVFSDPVKPAALIQEDEKGKAYVPLDEIPRASVREIENFIASKGYKVTKDKVQRIWAARMMNDRKLVDQILGE